MTTSTTPQPYTAGPPENSTTTGDANIDPSSLNHFRNVREADYKMILSVQAMIGEHIDPDGLEYITRREVEAGRLSADDKFRLLAVAGATVLGTRPGNAPKRGGWLGRLFRKG